MNPITSSKARMNFFSLIDEVNRDHKPAFITGKRGNAVLVAEEDWLAIEETLFLNGIPDMANSIVEGMNAPVKDCSTEPGWN